MVFVPSRGGISHNPAEHTDPADLAAGVDVLLHVLLDLANGHLDDRTGGGRVVTPDRCASARRRWGRSSATTPARRWSSG